MAIASFIGRVLFVSVFLLSAWHEFNEFGSDGGPTTKSLDLKINLYSKYRMQLPDIETKYVVAAVVALKVLGSLLFVFGSSVGGHLLVFHQLIFPVILYDFYNYDADEKEFAQFLVKFTENLAMLGALCFFIGMKNSMPRRIKKKDPKTKKN